MMDRRPAESVGLKILKEETPYACIRQGWEEARYLGNPKLLKRY